VNDRQPRFFLPEPQPRAASPGGLTGQWTSYSIWAALILAFVAGLSLNIMPCVWPVLPIIVMRLVEQARQSKGKSVVMGLAFCLGILLFFACLAGANIILQVFYGQVLQWGDQLRNPGFVAAMAMLLVVLALFMFGVFTINVPSSLASKGGSGKGLGGAVGMGFLAHTGGGIRMGAGPAVRTGHIGNNDNRNRNGGALRDIDCSTGSVEKNTKAGTLDGAVQTDHWLCASRYRGQTDCRLAGRAKNGRVIFFAGAEFLRLDVGRLGRLRDPGIAAKGRQNRRSCPGGWSGICLPADSQAVAHRLAEI
jgi:hypothetical protein